MTGNHPIPVLTGRCKMCWLLITSNPFKTESATPGMSADLVHGCGRVMWQIHRTGRLAAREAQCEAVVPVDTPACATRSARALGPRASVGHPERGGTAGGRSHNSTGIFGGVSTQGSQASSPPPCNHEAAATLRVSVHRVRSASFPTGGKVIMTRFGSGP
jgi:hypothetical protein